MEPGGLQSDTIEQLTLSHVHFSALSNAESLCGSACHSGSFWGQKLSWEPGAPLSCMTFLDHLPGTYFLSYYFQAPPGYWVSLYCFPGHNGCSVWCSTYSMLSCQKQCHQSCLIRLCLWVVKESCPTTYNPMNCSSPGSSVHMDSPGQNTGVGCHALLQGIFPTQGLNPHLTHCKPIVSPYILTSAWNWTSFLHFWLNGGIIYQDNGGCHLYLHISPHFVIQRAKVNISLLFRTLSFNKHNFALEPHNCVKKLKSSKIWTLYCGFQGLWVFL